jgi:hypothetical protein
MIEGDLGHIVADDRHFSAVGLSGCDTSDDDKTSPTYENSPATPVNGGQGPQPELSLSCYGSGTRQSIGRVAPLPSAVDVRRRLSRNRSSRPTILV